MKILHLTLIRAELLVFPPLVIPRGARDLAISVTLETARLSDLVVDLVELIQICTVAAAAAVTDAATLGLALIILVQGITLAAEAVYGHLI